MYWENKGENEMDEIHRYFQQLLHMKLTECSCKFIEPKQKDFVFLCKSPKMVCDG